MAPDPADRVAFFDTTLRDGEQSPGVMLRPADKAQIAGMLERLGVDVIEAGFPAASPGDAAGVAAVAAAVSGPTVCALARTAASDIAAAAAALAGAGRSRIHTFIAASDIHLTHKLQISRSDAVAQARAAVTQAAGLCDEVQFSAEDASRSDPEFLLELYGAAAAAGATIINIPDTVGYAQPGEFAGLVASVRVAMPSDVTVAVHCHDDLGLAVANSLAGLSAGARQYECAVNGIGERAGNAALEEMAMLLATRRPGGLWQSLDTRQLGPASRLVSRLSGYPVQPNKAVVGRNAFAHEAGIHQDGMLKNPLTYEIMSPQDVGAGASRLVLGKHSGRHALRRELEALGVRLDGAELNAAFKAFKALADSRQQVTAADLEALAADLPGSHGAPEWELEDFHVQTSMQDPPLAQVTLRRRDGQAASGEASGDGPVDALCWAINDALGLQDARLLELRIEAVTQDAGALGEAAVRAGRDGREGAGRAASTDIAQAAARAYLRALAAAGA